MTDPLLQRLIEIESGIHYNQPPPVGVLPFVVINRNSPILLSAPHGCRTYRYRNGETWHEEDEYTAGLALLLGELCEVSVIATIWRTDASDPNDTIEHDETMKRGSPYKKAVRTLCKQGVRWVVDLHGASQGTARMAANQFVDLGTRRELKSLPDDQLIQLQALLETHLGKDIVHHNGFPAREDGRSITAFCHGELGVNAVQVEMKPAVRVPWRRTDATLYASEEPFAASPEKILGMMQGIADFVEGLNRL